MLRAHPHLRATTLLEDLQRRYPERYPDRLLRTLQRRLATWRATEGPEREIIFRQEHPPGDQALSDFTDGSSLQVTIAGEPFAHLLYHFWLAFSGWQYVKAIQGGESYTALTEGLQEALWQLGGVPRSHRTDRLSAAYRNLQRTDDEAAAYAAFCQHYAMEPTRNNAGVSHENGSVEAAHGHLKLGLKEALALRGSRDFPDLASYQAFLAEVVMRKNARRRTAVETELKMMRRLPRFRTTDFSLATVTVTRSATISVRAVLYTVPSRLIGSRLKVHIYDDRLVCWLGTTPLLTLPRRFHKRGAPRQRVVDYRHLIGAPHARPPDARPPPHPRLARHGQGLQAIAANPEARALELKLAAGDWIRPRRNLLMTGPRGVGKSWLSCALGHKACREDLSVLYYRVPRLFAALALARGDAAMAGSCANSPGSTCSCSTTGDLSRSFQSRRAISWRSWRTATTPAPS